MSVLLTESIEYNVNGAKGILDNFRVFAASVGWTIDLYETGKIWQKDNGYVPGSEDFLHLFSEGWGNQNMVYRLGTGTRNIAGEAVIAMGAINPANRNDYIMSSTLPPMYHYNWNSTSGYYYQQASLPSGPFEAMYMYGNKYFICCVCVVSSTSVIHICLGSIELYKSWRNYANGLFYHWPVCYYHSAIWSNMNLENNKGWWYGIMGAVSTAIPEVYFEGGGRTGGNYSHRNFYVNGATAWGSEGGSFNRNVHLLNYNTYTEKRVAFNTTYFIRNPTSLLWYPCGVHPVAYLNGRNLTIGQIITFGGEKYRVFPNVYTSNEAWVGFLIESV